MHSVRTRVDAEAPVEVLGNGFDSVLGDEEAFSDLVYGEIGGEHREHVVLAAGQGGEVAPHGVDSQRVLGVCAGESDELVEVGVGDRLIIGV